MGNRLYRVLNQRFLAAFCAAALTFAGAPSLMVMSRVSPGSTASSAANTPVEELNELHHWAALREAHRRVCLHRVSQASTWRRPHQPGGTALSRTAWHTRPYPGEHAERNGFGAPLLC